MGIKKGIKKGWDFATTLLASLFFLVLAIAMTTGQLSLAGVAWLSWIPTMAVIVVGWVFVILIIANVATSIWNLFTK